MPASIDSGRGPFMSMVLDLQLLKRHAIMHIFSWDDRCLWVVHAQFTQNDDGTNCVYTSIITFIWILQKSIYIVYLSFQYDFIFYLCDQAKDVNKRISSTFPMWLKRSNSYFIVSIGVVVKRQLTLVMINLNQL